MIRYILQRLLATVAILLAVIFVIYGIVLFSPGDPATTMLGIQATPEAVAELNAELGYDRPFLVQYVDYVKNLIVDQDMGTSFKYGTPVWGEISLRFPRTLLLVSCAVLIQSVLALTVGLLCVRHRGKFLDHAVSAVVGFTTAVPSYASALVLIVVFSVWLELTPVYGVRSWTGYILPVVTLVLASMGYPIKTVRNAMLDTLQQDYVRTARAIGEPERRVVYAHALRNALVPIVTTLGYQFASMLGGTVVTESIFSINGVGALMVDAVQSKDIPLMMGVTVCITASFCLVQLLMELSYLALDPRIRAKYGI